MRIGFLSFLNPHNINNWSGTLYFIYNSLQKDHFIEWIYTDVIDQIRQFHLLHYNKATFFYPEKYAAMIGKLLSDELKGANYDIIIARDSFFIAYLSTDIPIIYIGDTTFNLFRSCMLDSEKIALFADETEKRALHNSDLVIFSSEWAKDDAVLYYNVNKNKIKVIEFGANIVKTPHLHQRRNLQEETCQLLFIGKEGYRKGVDKVYKTFQRIVEKGVLCHLTIIGCSPTEIDFTDENITIVPYLDKSIEKDNIKLFSFFSNAHFFILPTRFECFGIVFCEASAFGVPSLASDVGGISQVIHNGKNGFLFPSNASPEDYAEKVISLWSDKESYRQLRTSTRQEFDQRLNWEVWREKTNLLISRLVHQKAIEKEEINSCFIPVYVINVKERTERKEHILREFEGKEEFEIHIIEAIKSPIGAVGLWQSMCKAVRLAIDNNDDVMIICEDDHYFTPHFNKTSWFKHIHDAHRQGADVLSGGIGGFGTAIPVAKNRYWIDWFWCTQFIVIYKKFYQRILEYNFEDTDTADGVISKLSNSKMTVYPFISMQKDFGYSDVTLLNNQNKGLITNLFADANARILLIDRVFQFYNNNSVNIK